MTEKPQTGGVYIRAADGSLSKATPENVATILRPPRKEKTNPLTPEKEGE